MSARRLAVAWLPVVACAALIFVASGTPDLRFVPDQALDFVVRKVGHVAVFGVLALLAWRAVASTTNRRRPWAWALALTFLYAASDELHQGIVVGRHAAFLDIAIDAAGAVAAVGFAWLVRARRARITPIPG